MSIAKWRGLSARERALVAVAVLIDGSDSRRYLEFDAKIGSQLGSAADELCALEVDARMAFVGTALRLALDEEE